MSLLRKEADPKKPFTAGEQIGTYVNPFQTLTGRVAVPDVANKLLSRAGASSQNSRDAIYSALAMLGTFGVGAYGLQWALAHTPTSAKPTVYKEQIKSYLNASQPIVAPDPVTLDKEHQRKLESTGMGGALNTLGEQQEEGPAPEPESLFQGHAKESGDASALALPVAALLAGGYLGTTLGVKAVKKSRQGQFNDKIEEAKNELNALNYRALLRARGLTEPGIEPNSPSFESAPLPKVASNDAVDYVKAGASKLGDLASDTGRAASSTAWGTDKLPEQQSGLGLLGGTKAIAALGALGLLGGGAYFAKQYFDSNDPARKNLKKMRNVAREQALMEEPPVVMPMMSPEVLNAINAHINKTRPADLQRKALQAPAVPFDPADATMKGAMQNA